MFHKKFAYTQKKVKKVSHMYADHLLTKTYLEDTLYGVNNDLSLIRRHIIWSQKGLDSYKKKNYMGSKRTCLLQEDTLYEVKRDLSVTNEIRFVKKEFGQWGFSKFESQPIELLDT